MAKTRTTKFQTYPQPYQFGGLNLPFLDQYTNLTKQWGNFWRNTNYNSLQGPTNPLLTDTIRQNDAAIASKKSAQDYANKTGAAEWGNKALDYTYRKDWDTRNPNATDADRARFDNYSNFFSQYENGKAAPGWNGIPTLEAGAPGSTLGDYNAWKTARTNIADQAKEEWANNNMSYNEMDKNANKETGAAMKNSAAGIFSGLNYMNAYTPPEQINLQQGNKGIMYAQDGALIKGPGMMYSPMMKEFGGIKTNTSKWAHFPDGKSAINALDSMLTSGRSKIYKEDMSLADVMSNYDPRLGNTAGKFSKYTIKDLKNNPNLKNEFLQHVIKNEVSAEDYDQYYEPVFMTRTAGPSLMQYQVTSRQEGGNVNLEGYTPGTPSMNNDMNEIPSGDITMEQTPIPLLAIGKGGADNGLLKVLQPQSKGYNFKSKSTVEIPLEQQQQDPMMAKYGKLISALNNYNNGGYIRQYNNGGNPTDPSTKQLPIMDALKIAQEKGLLLDIDPKEFYKIPIDDQKFILTTAFNKFNNEDPRSTKVKEEEALKSGTSLGTPVATYVRPLSTTVNTEQTITEPALDFRTRQDMAYAEARRKGLSSYTLDGKVYNTLNDPNYKPVPKNLSTSKTINTSQTGLVRDLGTRQFGGYLPYAQTGLNLPVEDPGYQGTDWHIAQPRNTNNDPNYMGENDLYYYKRNGTNSYIRKHKRTQKEEVLDQKGIERALQEDNLWTNPATTPNNVRSSNTFTNNINQQVTPDSSGNVRKAVYQAADQEPPYQEPGIDTRFMPDARFNRPSVWQGAQGQVSGQNNMMTPSNGVFPQQAAYTQPLSGDDNNINSKVYSIKGDKTYDYAQDANGNWFTKRKNSSSGWINMRDKLSSEDYKKAVNNIQQGNVKKATTATGKTKTSSTLNKNINQNISNAISTGSGQNMQLVYDETTGQSDIVYGNNPEMTPVANSVATNTTIPVTTSPYVRPDNSYASSLLMGRGPVVNQKTNSNNALQSRPTSYPSISDLKGETESRAFGLLKMTPNEAKNYDTFFQNLAPEVKNNAAYLKKLDSKHVELSKKAAILQNEINSLKVQPTTTDFQREKRTIKEKELAELQKNISEVKKEFTVREQRLNSAPRLSYKRNSEPRTPWKNLEIAGRPAKPKTQKLLNALGLYKYGGYVPKFQYGGSVNDEHAVPVFSSNLEDFGLTELQTEKGEIAFMPDGSLPNVKAKELHKHQDKDDVSDIMQSGTYIFSNDPKMKFGIKSKIGGVELGDMKLGKSVFKYKENEITPGPEDIMLKDMFFNGSKKELTTADIAKNIKKNLPVVDLKNDYFADRAIAENKSQRVEYLSVLKAFNEFKKPKQRSIPKAQYGMPIQYSQNGLDGVMGYGMKQADPFYKMDNNMVSMWNMPQPKAPSILKAYEDGGTVEHAQLGKLLRHINPTFYIPSEYFANRAKKKQERENAILNAEATGYRDQLQRGVDTAGGIGVGTNLATYAASLNVPLQKYDDQSEQMAMYNAAANRATQRLESSKYTASQGIGGASSLARYSNPTNYGDYLSKVQSQSDGNIGKLNQAIADLDMARANQNVGFISSRNAGRNQALNARDTQLYNANVQGIGNVGRSAQEATFNSADTKYRLGQEKMAYDSYLKDKAQGAKDRVIQGWEGSLDALGQLGMTAATGGFGSLGGGSKVAQSGVTDAQQSYNNTYMQNQMKNSMSQVLQNRNNSYNSIQPLPPLLNRNGVNTGNFLNRNTDNWDYNFFDPSTWR